MRIAIDARMARKPLSGPGRYAINLIRALARLDHENQYVVIQGTGFSERITEAENFKTIWINYPALSLRTVFWLQSALRKEKVQLVHSLYFLTPLGGDFLKVITVHDLMALKFPNFFQGRALPIRIYAKLFTRAFISSSVIFSSAIITDSEIVRDEVTRWKPEYGKKNHSYLPRSGFRIQEDVKRNIDCKNSQQIWFDPKNNPLCRKYSTLQELTSINQSF